MIKMPSVQTEGKIAAHYFMGAYTYSPEPHFTLLELVQSQFLEKGSIPVENIPAIGVLSRQYFHVDIFLMKIICGYLMVSKIMRYG